MKPPQAKSIPVQSRLLLFSFIMCCFLLSLAWMSPAHAAKNETLPLPQTLSPTGNYKVQPAFVWKSVAGAAKYELKIQQSGRRVLDQHLDAASLNCNSECSFMPDISVRLGSRVQWKVRAFNAPARSGWTSWKYYTLQKPEGPELLAPTINNAVTVSQPDYQWRPVAGALGYKLEVRKRKQVGKKKRWVKLSAHALGADACTESLCEWKGSDTLTDGSHRWKVSAELAAGFSEWSKQDFEVAVAPNLAPTAEITGPETVFETQTVTLSGSGVDKDGSIAAYSWALNGEELSTKPEITYTIPDFTTDTNLVFTLTVTDDRGATATSHIDLMVLTLEDFDHDLKACIQSTRFVTDFNGNDSHVFESGEFSVDKLLSLEGLNCSFGRANDETDFSQLKHLPKLTGLSLIDNNLTDISLLGSLTSLTSLALSYNNLTDISPLGNLTSLTSLNLDRNQLTSINALSSMKSLTLLRANSNQLNSDGISGLSSLAELTSLGLGDNKLDNVDALAQVGTLGKLESLLLSSNQLEVLPLFNNLESLIHLSLNSNQLTSVDGLSGLHNLTYLYLGGNELTDISALGGLSDLSTLNLHSNQLADDDLIVFDNLKALQSLDLSENQLSGNDLLFLPKSLTSLNLSGNNISGSLSGLRDLANLTHLGLNNNELVNKDLDYLLGFGALTSLSLNNNLLTDISSISTLANLKYLYIGGNCISDFSGFNPGILRYKDMQNPVDKCSSLPVQF